LSPQFHFISGLPRSGSTLLSALLRQNPRFHAGMSSPVAVLFERLQGLLSAKNEFHVFFDDRTRAAILAGLLRNYYAHISDRPVVFDTSRMWSAKVPAISTLFPESKIICCVRDVPEIINSVENLVLKNALQPSSMFNFDPGGNVYIRTDLLMSANGMIGAAHNALKGAFYGPHVEQMLLITYESLTKNTEQTLARLYAFLGETPFDHDLSDVAYEATDFDAAIGTPGLHTVRAAVSYRPPEFIIPPDLVQKHAGSSFWRDAAAPGRPVVI